MTNVVRESGFFPACAAARFESDDDLIAGMLANDPPAWREFQKRYDRLVMRCITKVTRRFSTIVSQDDVREIYATFYVSLVANDMHKLRTFDPERGNRFSSWIGLLAINSAYDYLRGLKREPQKECITEAVDVSSDLPDPFELTSDLERASIAHKTLEEFSAKDRTFAALYFGEGMAPQDIAEKMNISVKTVYSKKHKIQSRLESVLATRTRADVERPARVAA
jgi:RNA polymerase sigma-70 factor (ECF subfamily)